MYVYTYIYVTSVAAQNGLLARAVRIRARRSQAVTAEETDIHHDRIYGSAPTDLWDCASPLNLIPRLAVVQEPTGV